MAIHAGPDVVAHGVAEDLAGGQADTRIVCVLKQNITLGKGATAQFIEPGRSLPGLTV